ncbi:MAG TPA: ferritin-like domain-containing protein, partial [Anaeromyxobacter sp.]
MSATRGETVPGPVRRVAASAWTFRCRVELEAEARFERLAGRMERIGAAGELVALARRASADERRHAALCAEQAALLGETAAVGPVQDVPEIAPATLPLGDRVLYEVVAACCISETESMGVLTTLLDAARAPGLRRTLRELASDEVQHARLGWAYLARAHAAGG